MRPLRLVREEAKTGEGLSSAGCRWAADIAALADPTPECWAFWSPFGD